MRILVIDRTFVAHGDNPGGEHPHLPGLSRGLVDQGHQVTVLARLDAPEAVKGGRITLLQQEGLAVVCYAPRRAWPGPLHRFARWAAVQGKNLPRPGLILAAASCLPDCRPALYLRHLYRVPLVLEVSGPLVDSRKMTGIRNWKPFRSHALRWRRRAYLEPETVIALNEEAMQEAWDPEAGWRHLLSLGGNGDGGVSLGRYAEVLRSYTE